MKFYVEISLLPGSDIDLSFLRGRVFQQIHLALVEQLDEKGNSKIGLSFPKYVSDLKKNAKDRLGEKIRLFAMEEKDLEQLNIIKWLNRLKDYVHATSIRPIPKKKVTGHVIFKRERPKSNLGRIARRKAKRAGISEAEALKQLRGFKERFSLAPFIDMHSLGTDQKFKLFILRQKVDSPCGETFGSYGLGVNSSVPEF